jgi:EF hand
MRLMMALAVCGTLGGAASAQDADSDAPDDPALMPQGLQSIAPALAKRLQRDADDVIEDAMTLILGYGTNGGIDTAGIRQSLQVDRAGARANVIRRLVEADLDADGTVTTAEAGIIAGAAAARIRGRIMLSHAAADADGDGRVTQDEARTRADAMAMEQVSETDADRALSLMGLDLDADGILTLSELAEVTRLMRAAG